MILQTMFRNIIYKIYDYKAQNIHADDIKFVVIHIPDQIGDAIDWPPESPDNQYHLFK